MGLNLKSRDSDSGPELELRGKWGGIRDIHVTNQVNELVNCFQLFLLSFL